MGIAASYRFPRVIKIGETSSALPSDGMQQAQRGEGGAHVGRVAQDEAQGPLHALFPPFGHEGRDPQHAAAQAPEAPREAPPPLVVHQIPESSLHHRRVHGHQVGPTAHVVSVFLHRCQVAPSNGAKSKWAKLSSFSRVIAPSSSPSQPSLLCPACRRVMTLTHQHAGDKSKETAYSWRETERNQGKAKANQKVAALLRHAIPSAGPGVLTSRLSSRQVLPVLSP